jgi:hypothetical protein
LNLTKIGNRSYVIVEDSLEEILWVVVVAEVLAMKDRSEGREEAILRGAQ